MMIWQKYKYIILSFLAMVLLMYWLIEGGKVDDKPMEKIKLPNSIINDANLSEEKNGKKFWELFAKRIEIENETNKNIMSDVKGKLYREDGTTIEVTAKNGEYTPQNKQITLTGDVLVVYSEGWTLKSQKLHWDPDKEIITASEKASFDKDDIYAEGDKIETDREATKIKITGHGTVKKRR